MKMEMLKTLVMGFALILTSGCGLGGGIDIEYPEDGQQFSVSQQANQQIRVQVNDSDFNTQITFSYQQQNQLGVFCQSGTTSQAYCQARGGFGGQGQQGQQVPVTITARKDGDTKQITIYFAQ